MREINERAWKQGFAVLYGKWMEINTIEIGSEKGASINGNTIILESNQPTPEEILIKKDAFNNLSTEAKEIIRIILNTPSEMLQAVTTKKANKISRPLIQKYLSKIWHSKYISETAMEEVAEWAKQL